MAAVAAARWDFRAWDSPFAGDSLLFLFYYSKLHLSECKSSYKREFVNGGMERKWG